MIGKIFKNTDGYEFIVLEKSEKKDKKHSYYKIKFIESGFIIDNARSDSIKNGRIKDKLVKTLFGVGSIGYANTREDNKKYKLWYNMLSRCYNKKDKSYKYYGAKGITVESRWHRYDFFLNDIEKIEGWNKEEFYKGNLFLDKDIKSNEFKIYSLETCKFVSQQTNQQQRTEEYNLKHIKMVIFPDGHEEEIKNLSQFCIEHNLHRQNAQGCLNGKQKQTKGFKFYYK